MLYIIDTSVLLADPKALTRLSDRDIVIPLVVVTELESKKAHPDLGYAARQALRILEHYRTSASLADGVATEGGGSVRVEINNINESTLPDSLRTTTNDNRILAVATNLAQDHPVTLLTKDLTLRLKASVAGIEAEDFLPDKLEVDWQGWTTLAVDEKTISDIYAGDSVSVPGAEEFPVNTNFILTSSHGSALARITADGMRHVKDHRVFDIKGRSAEQRFALDMLTDESLGIVSIGGKAGTGKSILALAAGLEAVVERRTYKKVVVFRPLYAVGGQDLGFLPGTAEEKMSPWAAAVYDALEVFCGPNVIEQVIEDNLLEVLPLTHIRGRTLSDTYVIIDEAQNLERMVLLTALSRLGAGSKAVVTHDVGQRDNLRVGKYDGIMSVIGALSGSPLFGHITLSRSERSPVAELVSRVIES